MQYGFYFDNGRCTGCKTCELACKDYNDLDTTMLFRKVYDFEGGTWTQAEGDAWTTTTFSYHVSAGCNHCDAPLCMAFCQFDAILRDEDTGIVFIDEELCTGCEECVGGCPYAVPRFDAEQQVARKCDGCLKRIKDGKQAICAESCPLRALAFDDIESLRASYGTVDQIPPLPEPKTNPNLVINASPAVGSPEIAEGYIANDLEVA
ncbi:MAG: 4Fe-4S binding protein [Coriobacteriia bacterium]|nr:4Fe-4S binding protein [Coriobacteriia bacterium]